MLLTAVRRYATRSPVPSATKKYNPNNYFLPIKPATMEETMEPYGPWEQAYKAEKKDGNIKLAIGFACLFSACTFFYQSGTMDYLFMPNLDNVMEETVSLREGLDLRGRVSVRPLDYVDPED